MSRVGRGKVAVVGGHMDLGWGKEAIGGDAEGKEGNLRKKKEEKKEKKKKRKGRKRNFFF